MSERAAVTFSFAPILAVKAGRPDIISIMVYAEREIGDFQAHGQKHPFIVGLYFK